MSKKQQIESSITPELTSIEDKLLAAAKIGQPVLLYGKDTIGRKDLILRIHILSGGIDSSYEFFDPAGKPISRDVFIKNIADWHMSNNPCPPIDLCHSRGTSRTWDYVNCSGMEAKEFYEELVEKTTKLERELDAHNALVWKAFNSRIAGTSVGRKFSGCLFECNGLLFIDNLSIYNKKDINFFDKLANIIEDRCLNYHITTFNWLVVYMPDLENLPPSLAYFREQFEPVSLAPDKQKEIDDTTPNTPVFTFNWSVNENLIYSNEKFITALPNIQLKLFVQLNNKSGRFVKNTTLEKCWNKKPSYERFLNGTINKLENTLKEKLKQNGIDIKDRIIEPKPNNTRKYTAYKLKP